MDVKSMAKSKRSHTQHNQPRKPHHPPKLTPSTNNSSNLNKENKEKIKVVDKKASLPSNWDRYDDNIVEEEEQEEIPIDDIKPKSKGADFRYLIAQAKESKQLFSPSFGHTLDGLYQGLTPMLDVKSEGIPSWVLDDDFLLENEATTSEEAPNFSLDLKALSEELAKADLARRLFIEPDLLPPELGGQDGNVVSTETRIKTFDTFQELYSIYLADEKTAETKALNKEGIISSSDNVGDTKLSDPAVASISPQGISMLNIKGDSGTQLAHLPQIVTILDDELDDLLDSSSLNKKDGLFQSIKVKTGLTDDGPTSAALLLDSHDPSMSAFPVTSCSLDDELDNLLKETSKPTEAKVNSSDFPSSSISVSLRPGSNAKVLDDDFDSWLDTL
ncbi:protein ECERIFERUM 16 [Silene latifolia]|uniref:protein ECERIFERUM 16 n=1 Tax=Silene latifolia TaxID=37657 RepID=UPI003D76F204